MITPAERTRALRFAGELLNHLLERPDISSDIRLRAQRVLRHYPEAWQLHLMVQEWQRLGSASFGLAPEPGRPNPLLTDSDHG